ncbi:hypothetical protein [Bacillus paralicheniformis]|uniref:hypothetical protein n=1 Tax=Bacillus paralicheniformis TaxID=1648923 RepID=UPI002E1B06D3|nr:hypothetical protein [Bacillus paralicheniformis]
MTNKPTYEQLQEQYELTVLKSASYKETLDKAHNDLAEIKAFYMREKQKRKNLEQEVEKLKKELQEERIGNSQAEDEVIEMNQVEANKEYHEKRAEAAK